MVLLVIYAMTQGADELHVRIDAMTARKIVIWSLVAILAVLVLSSMLCAAA